MNQHLDKELVLKMLRQGDLYAQLEGYDLNYYDADNFKAAIENVESIPDAPISQWINVKVDMPKSGQTVLAFYKNSLKKGRTIRAQYVEKFSMEDTGDSDYFGEYDEETDTSYWLEGWYERNDNDENRWCVSDTVTHWMPLPEPPKDVK